MAKKQGLAKLLYEVLHPLHHDGDAYEPGAEIELADEHARPLLDLPKPVIQPKGDAPQPGDGGQGDSGQGQGDGA